MKSSHYIRFLQDTNGTALKATCTKVLKSMSHSQITQLVFESSVCILIRNQSVLTRTYPQLSDLLHSQDLQKSGCFAISKKSKKKNLNNKITNSTKVSICVRISR